MNPLSYEDEQEIQDRVANWVLDYLHEAVAQYRRKLLHAAGGRYFWDLRPQRQREHYAMYPPYDALGLPSQAGPQGEWDYQRESEQEPEEYERHATTYSRMMLEGIAGEVP